MSIACKYYTLVYILYKPLLFLLLEGLQISDTTIMLC
jgi:hypothetical protein